MVDPVLAAMVEAPIGDRDLKPDKQGYIHDPVAVEAGRRAQKIWLPEGKRSTNGREAKEARQAFYKRQVDLEDAVEAAGGRRGGASC